MDRDDAFGPPSYDAQDIEPLDRESSLSPPPQGENLRGAFWLYYLFFRPSAFFRHFVIESYPLLTGIAAWILGTVEAADKIEERVMRDEMMGRAGPFQNFLGNWSTYWLFCLACGAFGGLLYFSIGGWWYRKRLQFSGADAPDPGLARRVYLFASLVYGVPALLYAIWQTGHYPSPLVARSGEDIVGLLIFLFLLWSIYTSYRGARTAFVLRPWAARVWFAILPAAVYSLVFVGIALLMLFTAVGGLLGGTVPLVDQPSKVAKASFSVSIPGNWTSSTDPDADDPDTTLDIESPGGEAYVNIVIDDDLADDPQGSAEAIMNAMAEGEKLISSGSAGRWAHHPGVGHRFLVETGEGTRIRCLVFVGQSAGQTFRVIETCDDQYLKQQEPGLQLIRQSFRAMPALPAEKKDAEKADFEVFIEAPSTAPGR